MIDGALVLASFLLGSLPFSVWLVRGLAGRDLRRIGSGNPGATNALRAAGRRTAAAALALDVGKGALPVALALHLEAAGSTVAAVAVAAVCGHVFSPWLGFRGGKGVATALGTLALLYPLAALGGVAVFAVVVAWKRYVSLASLVAAGTILMAVTGSERFGILDGRAGRPGVAAVVVIVAIILVRHVSNLQRLVAGRESRVGEKAR